MVYPRTALGPPPMEGMPENVKEVFLEAREVAPVSRKSAAGLLRLALQLLLDDLEPGGGDINAKIGRLVTRGLDESVQQAMDVLRVVGNASVHPGQINLDDDDDLLEGLFELINMIVEQVIVRKKRLAGLFGRLPKENVEGIQRRDGR
jgi:hypothetical protein